jgi:two-component system nitrate/nitrite response regulator NarL
MVDGAMPSLRLFLVDRSPLFRDGLRQILNAQGCEVAGEASTLAIAPTRLAECGPVDVVAFDPAPGEECAGAIERLRRDWPTAKLVVLSGDLSRDAIAKAIAWSVDAYLSKDMSPRALAGSFELIVLGQQIFPTTLMLELREASARKGEASGAPAGLSARELELLRALVKGKSNKAIARDLAITEATVKVQLKTLLKKVRVNNRTQAAVWALGQGIHRVA